MKKNTFTIDVLDVVRLIPSGKVTTYGAIAAYLGSLGSSRMVGWILNSSKHVLDVPAHRVVNRYGLLTGKAHFETPMMMAEMLVREGVKVENNLVINFEDVFWDPSKELSL